MKNLNLLSVLTVLILFAPQVFAQPGKNSANPVPPVVSFATTTFTIEEGQNFSVEVKADDIDGRIRYCYINVNGGDDYPVRKPPYQWYGPRDSILTAMQAGSYALNATCVDDNKLETTISQTLLVLAAKQDEVQDDLSAPTLILPGDITAEANSSSGTIVNFTVSANDDTDPGAMASCSPASGDLFPLGGTTVNCSAVDTSGNRSEGSFKVSVVDTTNPLLTLPTGLTLDSSAGEPIVVSYSASAFDSVDGNTGVSCAPSSGSLFPVGDTTVACSTADSAGNTASDSFIVSVIDTSPEPDGSGAPVVAFSTQSFTVEEGENFALEVTASDADGFIQRCFINVNQGEDYHDKSAPYQWYSPRDPILTNLPAGNHTINASCRDNDGKETTISRTLVVQNSTVDQEAPVITVPSDISVTSESADGQIVTFAVSAVDAVDGDTAVFCLPESGDHFAVGDTTVICSATDNSGNTGEKSFLVSVTNSPTTGGERTAYLQWNIPTSRADGSPLNTSELGSYSIVYSTSATLSSATILDVSASGVDGELAHGHSITFPAAGSYYLGMAISDTNGNMSELSDIVAVNIP